MTEAVRRDSQVKELFCIDIKAISISTVENRVCWTWGYSWQYPLLCLHAALRKGNNNTNKTLFIHSLTLTLKKSSWCTTQQLGKVLINLFVRVVLPPLVTLKQKVIKMHINIAFQLFWSEKSSCASFPPDNIVTIFLDYYCLLIWYTWQKKVTFACNPVACNNICVWSVIKSCTTLWSNGVE